MRAARPLAALTRFVAVVALCVGPSCLLPACRRQTPEPLSIVLVTLDTTRPDHLGCYGYERSTSPSIDGVARRGVLFESAWASAPETGPSLASVLTSRRAPVTGVRANAERLVEDLPTMAEAARAAGLRTGAFVSTVLLTDRASGFARGFDVYDDEMTDPCFGHARAQRIAERTIERALAWVARSEQPYFLWVHLYDPHGPYTPPDAAPLLDESRDRLPPSRELASALIPRYQRVGDEHDLRDFHDVREYVDRYDREVAYMDGQVGRLLAAVDPASTLIAIHADHGEAFGEDDYWFRHGALLHDAALHVPLVIAGPGVPGGRRVSERVRNLDLVPTLLSLAGLPPIEQAEGSDLRDWLLGAAAPPPFELIAEARRREDTRDSTGIDMRWKLRRMTGDGVDITLWPGDPTELPAAVEAWLKEPIRATRAAKPAPQSEEAREALESLGYR